MDKEEIEKAWEALSPEDKREIEEGFTGLLISDSLIKEFNKLVNEIVSESGGQVIDVEEEGDKTISLCE